MRTDEIAPRVALNPRKDRLLFNPAFGGLLCAFVAGLYAASAFQAYQTGAGFDPGARALTTTFWFGMAVVGVVRGLRKLG